MSGSVFRWVGVCECLGLCSCGSGWSVFMWVRVCECLGLCSGGSECVSV